MSFLSRWLPSKPAPPAPQDPSAFTCIVCGHRNAGMPVDMIRNRECQSCTACRSSLRMRSIVHIVSTELFGKAIPLPDFPVDKTIAGLGMSDWEGYAERLAEKLAYTNTFYHQEPKLDIANVPAHMHGKYRFLISTDVFEHIPLFALDAAFANSRRLLRDDGFFVFTVPFVKEGATREHFPELHEFAIEEANGKRVLRNRTCDGREQVFEDLVFHGGDGMTLEMRMFSEPDIRARLLAAGFRTVETRAEHLPALGIDWPIDYAIPIVARA